MAEAKRSIDDILREDPKFRRGIELNQELLSNIFNIGYGEIEHLVIKEGKMLWKRQEIRISGNE